jgi:ParB/RepB/Spo0J family partition protein
MESPALNAPATFGEFPNLAANHRPLLRAIKDGHATSTGELCARSGVQTPNLKRDLGGLIERGLLVSTGPKTHEVALSDLGERTLATILLFESGQPLDGPRGVPLDLIDPNPFQSRKVLDPVHVEQLAESLRDKGMIQPLIFRRVGERFEQAFGHSRVQAARIAQGHGWLPADYRAPGEIRDLTDDDMADLDLVENVQRADLHWLDEAEAYLRHAERGKSASDIKRLVGEGGRKKRSIQDYTKMARELDADTKRRARLPHGHPDHLTVEQCKFMVGERAPKPAFELSPKLALAMVELLDAAEAEQPGEGMGDEVTVPLHRKPVGGPLITLSDRSLVRFSFQGASPNVLIHLTEDLTGWLVGQGFWTDRAACLLKVREAALGGLAAGAATADGRYATPELNPPEARDDAPEPLAPDPQGGQAGHAEDDDDEEIPPYLRRLAGGGDGAQAPQPAAAPTLKPEHALAVTELAHKLQRHGEARTTGRVVAVNDEARRADPMSMELVFERLVMFMPAGPATVASLTPTALHWLAAQGVAEGEDGPQVADEALQYMQAEQGHAPAETYVTDWLNVTAPAEAPPKAPSEPRAAPPAAAGADMLSPAEAEDRQRRLDDREARRNDAFAVLGRLRVAALEASIIVRNASAKRHKATETTPVMALLEPALAEADKLLKAHAAAQLAPDDAA